MRVCVCVCVCVCQYQILSLSSLCVCKPSTPATVSVMSIKYAVLVYVYFHYTFPLSSPLLPPPLSLLSLEQVVYLGSHSRVWVRGASVPEVWDWVRATCGLGQGGLSARSLGQGGLGYLFHVLWGMCVLEEGVAGIYHVCLHEVSVLCS